MRQKTNISKLPFSKFAIQQFIKKLHLELMDIKSIREAQAANEKRESNFDEQHATLANTKISDKQKHKRNKKPVLQSANIQQISPKKQATIEIEQLEGALGMEMQDNQS